MVGSLTSIYHGEESLPIQGIWARYRGRPARTCWGQNNRSIAQPAEYFRKGTRAIGTFSGKHCAVYGLPTAHRSPYRCFCLGQRLQHEEDVMQLVSYSPHSLDFTFVLYHSRRARQACCCSTRVVPCIPPSSLPFSSPSIIRTHRTMLCLTRSRISPAYVHAHTHTYSLYRLIPSQASNVF